ncbi:hypothetical protein VT84_17085 [Gemmata sp. SH-PL17]|uniref:hypothetical protein n=1 Tax=Gemmata sp. SH-PL17 TaxID=1630693 RepID=UPI00078DB3D9|nr:hypothetical protein [Gemmata sp. SH-PL17]AMV26116.1 hypothetical protein VT84_17085 [Gemmata sp. SH-PL17]
MGIANVQNASNSTGSGASLVVTVAALTAGNVIIVSGRIANEGLTLTPSATGVTFSTLVGPTNHSGAPNIRAYLWLGVVNTGGATSVTLTLSSSTDAINCWVSEFSGVDTVSPLDQSTTAQSSATGTSGNITGTVTTTQADELLIAHYALSGASAGSSPGSGYTTIIASGGNRASLGEYRIVAATGNYDCPFSWTTSRDWVVQFATLKAASSVSIVPLIVHHRKQQEMS